MKFNSFKVSSMKTILELIIFLPNGMKNLVFDYYIVIS